MINDNATKVIPVTMKDETIHQLDHLTNRVGAPSQSDTIRRAVAITDTLVNAIDHGERVLIESKNGKQRQVLISGVNR